MYSRVYVFNLQILDINIMLQLEVIGNIGSDAIIKDFSGTKYVSFNVASSETYKDQNGNKVETTTWVSVLLYGDGGALTQYLKKGTKVFVRGKMHAKVYTDKQGMNQCAVNLNASEINLCGVKSDGNAQAPNDSGDKKDDLPF